MGKEAIFVTKLIPECCVEVHFGIRHKFILFQHKLQFNMICCNQIITNLIIIKTVFLPNGKR